MLTTTYIINRIPTPVLGNVTPYEVLLQKKPNYTLSRVFGCLNFAVNPERVRYKMGPKGVPCVFLSYPQSQKGYKLLNILTNKLFVSKDVRFIQHIFPYSHNSAEKCVQPIPSTVSSTPILPTNPPHFLPHLHIQVGSQNYRVLLYMMKQLLQHLMSLLLFNLSCETQMCVSSLHQW